MKKYLLLTILLVFVSIVIISCGGAGAGDQTSVFVPPIISKFSFGPFLTTHYQMNYKFMMEAEIDERAKSISFDKIIPRVDVDSILVEIEIAQGARLTADDQTHDGPLVSFTFDPSLTTITIEEAGRTHDYSLSLTPTKLTTLHPVLDDQQSLDIGGGGTAYAVAIFAEANFAYVRNNLEKYFILVNDITLKNAFEPIGDFNTGFKGFFDGGGKTIRNFRTGKQYNSGVGVGFFGSIGTGGTVRDLKLILADGNADKPSIDGGRYAGALAGANKGGFISKVGVVGGYVKGLTGAGGLVGVMYGPSRIENSYVTGTVIGANNNNAGGLAGLINTNGHIVSIKNSYATGEVIGSGGGLVGTIEIPLSNGGIAIEKNYFDATLTGKTNGIGSIKNNHQVPTTIDITTYYTRGTAPNQKVFTMESGGREIEKNNFSDFGWDFVGNPANNVAPIWHWHGVGMWPTLR